MNISNALGARAASKVVIDGVTKDKKKQKKWVVITTLITILFVLLYLYSYFVL